ncbi:hypothetical protein DL96DRAFT_1708805 [Flagelloscypha sp. PMI_526]|nr:hypothetical protein DL96DRAFT_1708805 [Flagelloscypha sp. PMI_526]
MFSKLFTLASFLLFLSLQAHAHTIITPALGVKGKGARSDVQRPNAKTPCGKAALGKINDSGAVQAGADGKFTMTVTNFNGGGDGSRKVTAKANSAGANGKFNVNVNVLKNGNAAPSNVGSEQVTAQLPAGTKCTGGTNKNLCLVSVTTTAGFGNCVVVRQGAAKREYPLRAGTLAARSIKQRQEEELPPTSPQEIDDETTVL